MESFAVRVRDPAGEYWAQLIDPAAIVRDTTRTIVARLGLPQRVNYELLAENGAVLPATNPVRDTGVVAGATLILRPVRDSLFAEVTREIYEEALSNAVEQAWDAVRAELEKLYRLDPTYPDRQQLLRKAGAQPKSAATPAQPAAPAPKPPPTPPKPAAATSARTMTSAAPKAAATAAKGGSFLGRLVALVVVVVLAGAALIYFEVIPRPEWTPDWFPTRTAATTTVNGVNVGTGDVRVTLTWNSAADLDLHVTDPAGEEIYFGRPTSASGGRLDVDARAGCTNEPGVENVFWPVGAAPSGTYQVWVNPYGDCGAGTTAFEVTIFIDGVLLGRHTGSVNSATGSVRVADFRR